jgi:hypothetical protein
MFFPFSVNFNLSCCFSSSFLGSLLPSIFTEGVWKNYLECWGSNWNPHKF